MTNVDKNNTATYVSITISDNEKQLNQMREDANATFGATSEDKVLFVNSMDGYSILPDEIYLDLDSQPEIRCSFIMQGTNGKIEGTVDVPLTDELLADILAYGIKKLNKLKTAMEALQ